MILLPSNSKAAQRGLKLTIANLTLHEGGRRKARPNCITEIALWMERLVGCTLSHSSWAQVYVLRWWLQITRRRSKFLVRFLIRKIILPKLAWLWLKTASIKYVLPSLFGLGCVNLSSFDYYVWMTLSMIQRSRHAAQWRSWNCAYNRVWLLCPFFHSYMNFILCWSEHNCWGDMD